MRPLSRGWARPLWNLAGGLSWTSDYVALLNAEDTRIDLTGWVAAPRLVAGNPDSVDYMVKFLTFKSNNRNTVAFYVDGDRFRISGAP